MYLKTIVCIHTKSHNVSQIPMTVGLKMSEKKKNKNGGRLHAMAIISEFK